MSVEAAVGSPIQATAPLTYVQRQEMKLYQCAAAQRIHTESAHAEFLLRDQHGNQWFSCGDCLAAKVQQVAALHWVRMVNVTPL